MECNGIQEYKSNEFPDFAMLHPGYNQFNIKITSDRIMRRIQFDKCGEPEEVLYMADLADEKPGPGEVLLRIVLRPINPADIAFIRGLYVPPESYPATTGMEAVGVVEAVAEDVKGIKIGGRYTVIRIRGTWSEKMIVPADAIMPVPDDIDDETACQMHANPLTAYLLLQEVTATGAVVQSAAGSAVGRLVNQLGRINGRRVINVVRNPVTADDLLKCGTEHVVLSEQPDWQEQARRAAGDEPIVAAFDPVAGETGQDLLNILSTGGELILYGGLSGQPVAVNAMLLAAKNLAVRGFWLAPWFANTGEAEKSRVYGELISLFQQHQLKIPVADIFALDDFKGAIRRAQAPGRLGKILLHS